MIPYISLRWGLEEWGWSEKILPEWVVVGTERGGSKVLDDVYTDRRHTLYSKDNG